MTRPMMLLAAVLCLTGCNRLGSHPIVAAAKDEVTKNPRVAELLGGSIQFSQKVTGRANETDGIAAMQFEAKGSKAAGTVIVEGKKLGKDWGVTLLEVRSGERGPLSLTADAAERMGVDTPKFDPNATPSTTSAAPPPGDIEIAIPPGGPGS